MSEREEVLCSICKSNPGSSGKPWVTLNRISYGTGQCRGCTEFLNEDDECVWEVGDDLDAEREIVSGPLLCFPKCLCLFLEGRMLEADIKMGKTK